MFRDREHAGRLLAAMLDGRRAEGTIVLGLARGGVRVALEVARHLGAPLDALAVRRIPSPRLPGVAVGAIAEGHALCAAPDALALCGLGEAEVEALAGREAWALAEDARACRGDRQPPDVAGRTVILVDDGVVSGASARAAIRAARRWGAARVVVAAPVIARAAEAALREEADEVVALEVPADCAAVAPWYERLEAPSDEDLASWLAGAGGPAAEASSTSPPSEVDWTGRRVSIPLGEGGVLAADLAVPREARAIVLLPQGAVPPASCADRHREVARALQACGFATLLLAPGGEGGPDRGGLDLGALVRRVVAATGWVSSTLAPRGLPLGYLAAGVPAAAALGAAAAAPGAAAAVISCRGRLDLLERATLRRVRVPVLLVAGTAESGPRAQEKDERALATNERALECLPPSARLAVVRGATPWFGEPGAVEIVARLAARWLDEHLTARPDEAADAR